MVPFTKFIKEIIPEALRNFSAEPLRTMNARDFDAQEAKASAPVAKPPTP